MRFFMTLVLGFGLLFLISCEESGTDSEGNELQVSETVENNAAVGFQINQYVATGSEVESYTHPDAPDAGDDFSGFGPGLSTMRNAKEKAIAAQQKIYEHLDQLPALYKVNADSLLFEFRDTTGTRISRLAFYFDNETNLLKLIAVSSNSNANARVQYDSLFVSVDVGNGLDDDSDDRLQEFYNYQEFRENFIVQQIESSLTVTAWTMDGEPTGFTMNSTSWYRDKSRLERVERTFVLNPDESGSITETFYFRDGTTLTNTVTFNNNGTGTFSREFRNGTTVSGSFNTVEDDLEGFYASTTTFPGGFYLSEIYTLAEVSIDPLMESFVGAWSERITFRNGAVDSGHVDISVSVDDDTRTTELDITRINGAHGHLTIVGTDDLSTLNGWWVTFDDYYVAVTGEYYFDGSGWLRYEVYENETAYMNGDEPVMIAEYNFTADGGAIGTITSNGETYDVELDATGQGTLIGQTGRKTINLYRNNN